jgi:sensor histidine kinase YesM
MLQTLVENAIKHGLEPKPSGGMIEVAAEVIDKQLLVRVVDDGQGFVADSGGTGIGLRNVQERLRISYGERATFSLQSNSSGGVTAIISMPLTT